MAIFPYRCEPCDLSFDVERPVGGEPAPVSCQECGEAADQVFVAPQVLVRCREAEYGTKFAIPHVAHLDAYGRNSEQVERYANKFCTKKAEFHRQQMRMKGTSRNRNGMVYKGSIPMQEAIALGRMTGDKAYAVNHPIEALKRAGRLVE